MHGRGAACRSLGLRLSRRWTRSLAFFGCHSGGSDGIGPAAWVACSMRLFSKQTAISRERRWVPLARRAIGRSRSFTTDTLSRCSARPCAWSMISRPPKTSSRKRSSRSWTKGSQPRRLVLFSSELTTTRRLTTFAPVHHARTALCRSTMAPAIARVLEQWLTRPRMFLARSGGLLQPAPVRTFEPGGRRKARRHRRLREVGTGPRQQ